MILDLLESSNACVAKLKLAHKKVAFAESCTGGLLSKSITEHSGASEVFDCGVVSYSGTIKHRILGVCEDTLKQYGEVSSQTAREMARGIRKLSGADIGVGVTGIAGPTGGTHDKKVGLIYIGFSYLEQTYVHKLELYDPQMTRSMRREYAACFVFNKILELIEN